MLKRVEINGYRSCHGVVIDDINEVIALIGRNGAGKSNVLKAIEMLAGVAASTGPQSPSWFEIDRSGMGGIEDPVAFMCVVSFDGTDYDYSLQVGHAIQVTRENVLNEQFHFEDKLSAKGEGGATVYAREGNKINHLDGDGRTASVTVGNGVSSLSALSSLLPEGHQTRQVTDKLLAFFAGVKCFPLDEPAGTPPREFLDQSAYSYSRSC